MYQTDLTETEWQYITKVLNLQERKRKYDLRLIWNAIFYLVKTGCQWRMLPLDFPKWQLVYYYYRKWASQLDFDLLLEKLRGHVLLLKVSWKDFSINLEIIHLFRFYNLFIARHGDTCL